MGCNLGPTSTISSPTWHSLLFKILGSGPFISEEVLALGKTDDEEICDDTMPDFEMQKYRLGNRSQNFNEVVKRSGETAHRVKATQVKLT